MFNLEEIIKKAIPPEFINLAGAAGEWFANSGYREKLENEGTTGLTHIITKINGKPAVITFAASYLSEEDLAAIDIKLAKKAIPPEQPATPEPEPEETTENK